VIVLDASAAVEWLLRTPTGLRVESRLFAGLSEIHTPHLLDLEVAQTIRRLHRERVLDTVRASEAIDDLADLALLRHPHDVLLPRIWELRHTVTTYDAAYVALAESLRAPLVTCDARLRAARGHDAVVEVI
jgi:predicted nucleic acid-binding protein